MAGQPKAIGVIAGGLVGGEVGAGDDLCLGAGGSVAPSATRFAMASVLPVPLQ